jgi:hypothetical protein
MTTKRNNMFHDRGFTGAINLALQAIKEYGDLDKVKDYLLKFKESRAKWITDCTPGFARSSIETRSLITNHCFVTVKDGKYTITEKQLGDKYSEFIYWSENTSTQCIVVVYGPNIRSPEGSAVADFIDGDLNFHDNIASLIGIADDWEIIEKPMVIRVTSKCNEVNNDH